MRYHEGSDAEEMDRKDTVIDSTIHQYERRMDTLEEKFIEYASVVHSFLQTCLLVPYYLHATMVEFYGEELISFGKSSWMMRKIYDGPAYNNTSDEED